jgi:hypothetical protein
MTIGGLYRKLLWLYPSDFRQQFSEEMISVFEQRAGERFADRESVSPAFLLTEFTSVVKGAYLMWLGKILRMDRNQSASSSALMTTAALSFEDAKEQRDLAIRNMVAAIADHDFVNARRYSDEEARLKRVLEGLKIDTPATYNKPA